MKSALILAIAATLPAWAAPPPSPVRVAFIDGMVLHELDLRTGALDSLQGGSGQFERSILQDQGGGRWAATGDGAPWQRLTVRQGPRGWQACWPAPQARCVPAHALPNAEAWRPMSAADVLRLNGQLVLMHDHGETRLDLQRWTARSANSVIPVADLVAPWDLRDDGALVLHVANQVTWVLHLEARGPAWRVCERRARWTCHHARLEPPSQSPQNNRTR